MKMPAAPAAAAVEIPATAAIPVETPTMALAETEAPTAVHPAVYTQETPAAPAAIREPEQCLTGTA